MKKFLLGLSLISCSFITLSKQSKFAAHIKPHTYIEQYAIFSEKNFFSLYSNSLEDAIALAQKQSNQKLKTVLLIGNNYNLHDFNLYSDFKVKIIHLNCTLNFSLFNFMMRKYFPIKIDYIPAFNREFSFLISTTNHKTIKIYGNAPYGFHDESQYWTSHAHAIAILIDENNYIVNILDQVKSYASILKAFYLL